MRRSKFYRQLSASATEVVKAGTNEYRCTFRSAEFYLTAAEAAVELDDMENARHYLTELMKKRYAAAVYPDREAEVMDMTRDELRQEIRDERFRELAFEGHRWFDLRRYRVAEAYPQEVTLTKVVTNKVQDPNTYEYSVQWRRRFTLPNDDPAWVLPLPHEELTKNPGMLDNPRSDRSFELIN